MARYLTSQPPESAEVVGNVAATIRPEVVATRNRLTGRSFSQSILYRYYDQTPRRQPVAPLPFTGGPDQATGDASAREEVEVFLPLGGRIHIVRGLAGADGRVTVESDELGSSA
jgi:hypothetical protein